MPSLLGTIPSSETVAPEKLAQLVAQMDEPIMTMFLDEYEVDLEKIMSDNWEKVVRRAKTYGGRYWGLLTLLLLNDYTSARDIVARADTGKMGELCERTRFLLINVNDIKNTGAVSIDDTLMDEYQRVYDEAIVLIDHYELGNGYWSRSGVNLADEYESMEMYHHRVDHKLFVSQSMYESLWVVTKFLVYISALMPRIEEGELV